MACVVANQRQESGQHTGNCIIPNRSFKHNVGTEGVDKPTHRKRNGNHETKITLFTNPSAQAGYDTRSIFKRSLTGLNSEFSFPNAEEPSLPYYLPIARGRIFGFIPFPRVLVLCEM